MPRSETSEIKNLRKQLQDVKTELRLVTHRVSTGSMHLRDTKRITQLRSVSHNRILHPIQATPPHQRGNTDEHPYMMNHPHIKSGSFWDRSLRLMKAKWDNKLSKNATVTDFCDRIQLNSKMAVRRGGAKLVPLDGERPLAQQELSWNGWQYSSCPAGDYIRLGLDDELKEQCRYFTRLGICIKMDNCPYEHNLHRVAICRDYLAGDCDGECLLSHEPNAFNTPICRHAIQGTCRNNRCMYSHRLPRHAKDPRYQIWTCRPFALGGYCERGNLCPFFHLFNCPDYEENGTCPRGRSCTLQHNIESYLSRLSSRPSEESGVLCQDDDDEGEKIVISSYTVEPGDLLADGTSLDSCEEKKDFAFDSDSSDSEYPNHYFQ